MFERVSFSRGYRNIPTALTLSLQTQPHSAIPLQIYSAKILFRARFQGLRWFVYNYRIISWMLFSTIFYILTISSMAITWGLVSYFIFPAKPLAQKTLKTESEEAEQSNGHVSKADSSRKIKAEKEEDDSSLDAALADMSDTPTQFPTLSKQMPLRFPVQPQRSDTGRSPIKREPETTGHEPLAAATAEDAADDEEDDDDGLLVASVDNDRRAVDSGIGTSMESENMVTGGLMKRRSSRSLRGKDSTDLVEIESN
jgi:seipin